MMDIREYISSYRNHPILFIGTGVSLRYLSNSYTWDGLLKKIAYELTGNAEFFLDVKSQCQKNGKYEYDKVANEIESVFNKALQADRNGKFKEVNDVFYENMEKGVNLSRFKIFISQLLSSLEFKPEMDEEISAFKRVRKNIGSIITTNYDKLIECVFEFTPLIGNDILLSNPYGSVYKIHGCISDASKLIITAEDYSLFKDKYELIRAQLLSMFIHNPIIFLGYNIGDENIKSILKTIFTYVEFNSEQANIIRNNFLLVEYEKDSDSTETCEHDIDLEGFSTIRINKIKTDNFSSIYNALSDLSLPISAMDIRKVQSVVKEIYSGGNIKVNITEDLDALKNSDKIIAIGSMNTISYQYQTIQELMTNYFKVVEESNEQLLKLINKQRIQSSQYFPIFAFSTICPEISNIDALKAQQIGKIETALETLSASCRTELTTISDIMSDDSITHANKDSAILWATYYGVIELDDVKKYLIGHDDKKSTSYRRLLCAYDLKKHSV